MKSIKLYFKIIGFTLCIIGFSSNLYALEANNGLEKTITGTVYDEANDPLPGASVIVTGTSNGTTTDFDGNFELNVPDNAESLTVSFIGYKKQIVAIGTQTKLSISMELDLSELDEIVITGYGQTQNKMLVSTSISTIEAKAMIEDRPIGRLEQVLQGATPAVVVLQESGSPGAPLTVRMRGVGTAGNATPLSLLNGFQVPDMNFLNPNDISGIQVYKDAASSAIYGARGGNGVINLQTKEGSLDRPLRVNFSTYVGVQSLASEGDYLNTQEYAEYYNNSLLYLIRTGRSTVGNRPLFTDEEIALLPQSTWIEEVSDNATIRDHHISFSGGKGNTTYYLGAGLFDQGGIIGPTDFSRKSLNVNVNTKLMDRVSLGVMGIYTGNERNFIPENSENSRVMSAVASLPSIYPVYAEDGTPFNNGIQGATSYRGVPLNSIAEFGNPVLGFMHSTNVANTDALFGNALVKVDITDKLKFNTSYGYLSRETDIRGFNERFDYPSQQFSNPVNTLNESTIQETFWQWEGYFSYNTSFGDNHKLDAVLGTSILNNELENTSSFGINFTENTFESANFGNIENPEDIIINQPYQEKNTTRSYYGRVNYTIKDKYLFGATLRVDGSSRFGPNNKWGTFPSINAGWVISEEPFMESISGVVNLLKLRGSWGVNGNDRIPPYQYFDRYQIVGDQFNKQDFNPNIKWEEISQTNLGLDVDLFGNKVGLTLDYYVKETKDMLIDFPNPAFTGLPAPFRNAASVRNTGFETIVTYRETIAGALKLNLSMNIGVNKNEITDLGGGLPLFGAATRVFKGAPFLTRSDVGDPIASFYGFVYEGVDEVGDPVYKDISGPNGVPDGVISDEHDRTTIGNPYPDFIYGVNLSMTYKGFDFTTFVSGTQGNDVVNASMGNGFAFSNRTDRVLNAWSLENPTSQVMRPSATEATNHEFSDYYIEDGSYLRVKNITLGYTFPSSIVEKIKLDNLRIYMSANNMFTFTNYSGYDPEIGANNDPRDVGVDRGFYPQAKSIMGGLQLSF